MKQVTIHFDKIDQFPNALAIKFQGFLMNCLDEDYVDYLHEQATNPYATKLYHQDEETIWSVSLLNEEAERQILPVLLNLSEVTLHHQESLEIKKITLQELTTGHLLEIFNENDTDNVFTLYFQTPTGFKSQGDYVIFPSMRLIFQSLMQKYERLVNEGYEIEEDTLDYLAEHCQIISYRLETSSFKLHGRGIPSFKGRLTFRIRGAQTLKSYAHMLLTFGEFSGVGIKTSLGMGGLRVETREN